jgi:hypothetical protein
MRFLERTFADSGNLRESGTGRFTAISDLTLYTFQRTAKEMNTLHVVNQQFASVLLSFG